MNLTLPAGGMSPPSSSDMESLRIASAKLWRERRTRNRHRTANRLAGMGIAAQLLEETDLRLSEIGTDSA